MIKTPCEILIWNFLPSLRRELVKALVENGLERKEIAKIFGLSEAAICQYLKSRRGTNFEFNEEMKEKIDQTAVEIAESKSVEKLISEMCNICAMLRKGRELCKLCRKENPSLAGCKLYKEVG